MRKHVIYPFIIGTLDLSIDGYTSSTNILNQDNIGYLCQWSDLDGDGYIQAEVCIADPEVGIVTPFALLDMDPIPVTGVTGVASLSIQGVCMETIRLKYTNIDSTTGSMKVLVVAKTVGA